MTENKQSKLHSVILKQVVKLGHAPTLAVMAKKMDCGLEEVKVLLSELCSQHGLVLKPDSHDIWAVHPFSLMPTPIQVESKSGIWWACCALGALGIGSALHEDITIFTKSGAGKDSLSIQIRDSIPSDPNAVIYIPYPVSKWWNNYFCPCGEIVFFAAEEEVKPWRERHGLPEGQIINISTAIEIANIWWPDSLSPTWRRKTSAEINSMFKKVGLQGDFWKVDETFK